MKSDELKDLIRRRLPAPTPEAVPSIPWQGDYDLNPDAARLVSDPADLKEAGVLLPIIECREEATILLTRRTGHLNTHAGQISFPGGGREEQDPDIVTTALRETEEEVGIGAGDVSVAGVMAPYETRTGYLITPVVGFIAPDYAPRIDPFEVEEVFEVPVRHLFDPGNHERHFFTYRGVRYQYYAISYRDYFIWGATAGMLISLYHQLITADATED